MTNPTPDTENKPDTTLEALIEEAWEASKNWTLQKLFNLEEWMTQAHSLGAKEERNNCAASGEYRIKTSRSLFDSVYPAFRIEKRGYPDRKLYDIVWQANGTAEAIHMLVTERDLNDLKKTIALLQPDNKPTT